MWQNHKDMQEPDIRAEVAVQPQEEKAVTEPEEEKRLLGWGAPWKKQWPAPDTGSPWCPCGSDPGNRHSDLTLLPPSYLLSAFSINQTQLKAEVKGFRQFSLCRSAPRTENWVDKGENGSRGTNKGYSYRQRKTTRTSILRLNYRYIYRTCRIKAVAQGRSRCKTLRTACLVPPTPAPPESLKGT